MKVETKARVGRDVERLRALAMRARSWIKAFANASADPNLLKLATELDREAERIVAEGRAQAAVRRRP